MSIIFYDQYVCLVCNPFSQSFQLYLFLIHSISCRSLTTFSSFIFLSLLLPVFRKKLGQGKWMKNRLEIIRKQIVSSFVFCVLQYARCWWFVVRHLSYAQYRHWLVLNIFVTSTTKRANVNDFAARVRLFRFVYISFDWKICTVDLSPRFLPESFLHKWSSLFSLWFCVAVCRFTAI